MSKIPTSEEFIKEYNTHEHCDCRWRDLVAMREFAKLHVKQALEAAYKNGELNRDAGQDLNGISIDKDSILTIK